MKILYLDSGNTSLKYQLGEEIGIVSSQSELIDLLRTNQVRKVLFSDVAGQAKMIHRACRLVGAMAIEAAVVDGLNGLSLCYEEVSTLGVDRWLAMQAVQKLYPHRNVVVVDIGTAVKIDVVTKDGAHQGGSISPGLRLSNLALHENTVQLPEVSYEFSGKLGTSTTGCINYGLIMSVVALIERTVLHSAKHAEVIVTGGDAPLVTPFLEIEFDLQSNLVLEGLDVLDHAGIFAKDSK